MPKKIDLTGKIFERLTVLSEVGKNKFGQILWKCRCECGNETNVCGSFLKSGHTKSCGCYKKDSEKIRHITHGEYGTRAYKIWINMKGRCNNKNNLRFKDYGARGIKVCEEWNSFDRFIDDMGYPLDGFSIDRIDNDKGYKPLNCRWATNADQSRNKRNNRIIEFNNTSMCMSDWAKYLCISEATLHYRLEKWPIEKALTKKFIAERTETILEF